MEKERVKEESSQRGFSENGDGTVHSRIKWSVDNKRCAWCGELLDKKRIVGSGSFSDGLYCSLDCYAYLMGTPGTDK